MGVENKEFSEKGEPYLLDLAYLNLEAQVKEKTGAKTILMEGAVTLEEARRRIGWLLMTVNQIKNLDPSRVTNVLIMVDESNLYPRKDFGSYVIFVGIENLAKSASIEQNARIIGSLLREHYN